MVILEMYQSNYSKDLVAFDSLEEGRAFVSKIHGYTLAKEDQLEYEYFNPKDIPDYTELIYNGNIVPFSRLMFDSEENVAIIWKEISNLSVTNDQVIKGYSKIDAYVVNKDYIEEREAKYQQIKDILECNGYEVDRSFFGSEDGEAIIYRKNDAEDWNLLCHLDPTILEIQDTEEYVKEMMDNPNN